MSTFLHRRSLARLVGGFSRETGGNYAVIFGLTFATLAAAAGGAIDYGFAFNRQSTLKNAMDAAVLGAVAQKKDPTEQIAHAYQLLDANLMTFDGKVLGTDFHFDEDGVLVGTAKATVPTSLLKLIGTSEITVNIKSGAIRGPQTGNPLCIMAMHPTRKHTLEMKGKVSIYGPNCHIYGNSNNVDDVVDPHTPFNYMTGASVTAVGYGHHYLENVTPPLEGSTEIVADPYLTMALPSVGACTSTNLVINGGTVTLDPGVYCGGLTVKNGAKVTLNPGRYTIEGNKLSIDSSSIVGDGVTVYLSDRHAVMKIVNSTVRLVAPVAGSDKSFVMLSKREDTDNVFDNSTIDLYGIVYIPNASIDWTNSGTPNITAEWAAWIADGFSWDGDGTINFPYDISHPKVPHPSSLNVIPRPALKDVVRLVF